MTTRLRRALCAGVLLLLAIGADVPNANLGVSLYYSDAWQRARSYARDDVSSTWGLPDEGDPLGQSRCTAQIDNRSGAYSPDDARSPLYGLVGRNTPGRVALTPGLSSGALSDTADAFGRTVSNGWGSTDSGETWSLLGSGGSISTANWQVGSGVGTMNVPVDTAYRYSYLSAIDVRDVDVAVTFKAPQATGANLEPANILLRGDSGFDYVLARVTLSTGNAVGLQVYSRDDTLLGSATVAGLTHAGTGTPLRVRVLAAGTRIHMRVWVAANAEPDAWQLVVTDTTETPQSGWVGVRSGRATGNTNTTNPQFSYDDWESTTYLPIADGSVSVWHPDRDVEWTSEDPDRGDSWTDIEITGPSERVNASKTTASALRRTMLAASPNAYWPLEDPEGTTAPLSGLRGGPDGIISGGTPAWNQNPEGLVHGSTGLVDLYTSPTLLRLPLHDSGIAAGELQVEMTYGAPVGTGSVVIVQIATSKSDEWFSTTSGTGDGFLHHLSFHAVQNGGNVDFLIYIDGEIDNSFSLPTTVGTGIEIQLGGLVDPSVTGRTWYVGHAAAWATFNDPSERAAARIGYLGELAADRFVRLCTENDIPAAAYGGDSQPMGLQAPDTLANLLGEVQRTDMGMAYDARGWNGLELRTGRSLCNQTPALALTYGVNVAPPLKPATDNLGVANDITANDRSGATARADRSTGPLNVNDPLDDPEGIGRIESSTDVNVETGEQLADVAGWNLHVSTWPRARYQYVTVDLTKHPELLADVMAIRPGDLITIDELDADTVELLVLGGVDTIDAGGYHHRVTFNCTAAGPYAVATVGNTSPFARIGSRTSSLAADFDAGSDTSLSVAVTGVLWSTTAPPFNIRVGGVVLHVTAISGASSPQTFTVDATPVNGITRTLRTTDPDALKRVNIERPVYIGY